MSVMAEQQQRTDLTDLVRTRRQELGLSLRSLAAASVDPETGEQLVKYSWLARLENLEPVIAPQLPQLRAMAAGLKVPLKAVQDAAAAQFFGIAPSEVWSANAEASIVVARMGELSEDDRRTLAEMVELFARRHSAPGSQG